MKLTKRNLKELIQEEIDNLATELHAEDSSREVVGTAIKDLTKAFNGLSDIVIPFVPNEAFGYAPASLKKAKGLLKKAKVSLEEAQNSVFSALDELDPPPAKEDRE